MIPLVQEEVVDVNRWMTIEEFADALAIGYALPGPISTKMSAYVGLKVAGVPGLIAATLGVALPSLVAMVVLGTFFLRYKDFPQVQATLKAVRPAVVGLLLVVIYVMFPKSVTSWHTALIMIAMFALVAFLNVHPAWAIVGAAVVGVIFY